MNSELSKNAAINAQMVRIINTTNLPDKLAAISTLCTRFVLDDRVVGAFRYKHKLISSTRQYTRDQIKQLLSKQATHIRLDNNVCFVVNGDITQAQAQALRQRLATFTIEPPNWVAWNAKRLIVIVLLALFLLPVRENITTQGRVIAPTPYQVVATNTGFVTELVADGEVVKGQVIAKVANNDRIELDKAQAELANIEQQIVNEGSYATAALNVLYAKRRQLQLDRQRIQQAIADSDVVAPISGVINTTADVLGSYVQKGQLLGELQAATLNTIEITVDVNDWYDVAVGDQVSFYHSLEKRHIQGKIDAIRFRSELVNGIETHRAYAKVDEPLAVGTTGVVAIAGRVTVLAHWLFRKPINTVVASVKAVFY